MAKLTIEAVIRMISDKYYEALHGAKAYGGPVRKPLSWALYQTWKYVDERERAKKDEQ